MWATNRSHTRAFSLLELVVVLLIIALVIALLLPAVQRVRERARATVCLSNVQQWDHFFLLYLSANHNQSMHDQTKGWWEQLVGPGHDTSQLLLCPDAQTPQEIPDPPDPGPIIIR